jgi:hypothetical protein
MIDKAQGSAANLRPREAAVPVLYAQYSTWIPTNEHKHAIYITCIVRLNIYWPILCFAWERHGSTTYVTYGKSIDAIHVLSPPSNTL